MFYVFDYDVAAALAQASDIATYVQHVCYNLATYSDVSRGPSVFRHLCNYTQFQRFAIHTYTLKNT